MGTGMKSLPLSNVFHLQAKEQVTEGIKELWEDYRKIVNLDCPQMKFIEYVVARREVIAELSKESDPIRAEIRDVRVEIVDGL